MQRRKRRCIMVAAIGLLSSGACFSEQEAQREPRPVTVRDAIETTRLADHLYFSGFPSKGRVARFSPDGKRFVVVLRKGNVTENTNEFAMFLFECNQEFPPKPTLLVRMASSSNRDAITAVRWLNDNETILFLGENPGEQSQVYSLNAVSKQLDRLTNHATSVMSFSASANGRVILYAADAPAKVVRDGEDVRKNGVVIDEQGLNDLLAGGCRKPQVWDSGELFLQVAERPPVRIPFEDSITRIANRLSLSPDGAYAVVGVFVRNPPAWWARYQDRHIQRLVQVKRRAGQISYLMKDLLLDVSNLSLTALLNTPIDGFGKVTWGVDNRAIFMRNVRLPLLGVSDPVERKARERKQFDVEIRLPSRFVRHVSQEDWPDGAGRSSPQMEVTLREDMNTPPRIFISRSPGEQETLLMDLNPQFSSLSLGKAEIIAWRNAHGVSGKGIVYLPLGYVRGRRYPLVIQTHGYYPERFSMDGLEDWSTGFAARPLAANGFVVLQASMYADGSVKEGEREKERYEGAIDELDRRGLIDRHRVGIVGFSRTTYHVEYALTHSRYEFAAAVLTDGMDAGYFEHLVFDGAQQDDVFVNGGSPFGAGLVHWLRNSPEFNLARLHTPVRLQAQGAAGGILNYWAWHGLLTEMGKPVDFIYLPDAPHEIVKPWEQLVAQQGIVDWFNFWMKNEKDSDPHKAAQYDRWERLRSQLATAKHGSIGDQ